MNKTVKNYCHKHHRKMVSIPTTDLFYCLQCEMEYEATKHDANILIASLPESLRKMAKQNPKKLLNLIEVELKTRKSLGISRSPKELNIDEKSN